MIQKLIRQRLRWRCVIVLTVPESCCAGSLEPFSSSLTLTPRHRASGISRATLGRLSPRSHLLTALSETYTLGQLTLSQLLLTAQTGDKLSDFLIADLIHHPSLLPSIVRKRAAKSIYRQ